MLLSVWIVCDKITFAFNFKFDSEKSVPQNLCKSMVIQAIKSPSFKSKYVANRITFEFGGHSQGSYLGLRKLAQLVTFIKGFRLVLQPDLLFAVRSGSGGKMIQTSAGRPELANSVLKMLFSTIFSKNAFFPYQMCSKWPKNMF